MTPSRFEMIVDFADCDPARIVFYPRYFDWFDRATAAGRRQEKCQSRNIHPYSPEIVQERTITL